MSVTRHLAAAMIVCAAPAVLHACEGVAGTSCDPLFLPSVQYGAPLRTSAGLAVFIPTSEEGGARRQGFIVEGSLGAGGARGSFGIARFIEYAGVDARAVFTRTWASPREASARSTYAGAQAGLSIAYVRVSAGVEHRLSGPSSPKATILSWTVGVEFPLGRS